MRSNSIYDRLERLENASRALTLPSMSDDDLIDAMSRDALTTLQAERVFEIAGEDIKIALVLHAQYRRFEVICPAYRYDHQFFYYPVLNACAVLSPRERTSRAETAEPWPWNPDVWRYLWLGSEVEKNRIWARFYLIDRLIGHDGGMSLKAEIDAWIAGGPAPVDLARYPDVRTYRLLAPIDDEYDWQLLRSPAPEVHEKMVE